MCFTYLCHIFCHAHSHKQLHISSAKTQYHFQQVKRKLKKNKLKTERIWRAIEESHCRWWERECCAKCWGISLLFLFTLCNIFTSLPSSRQEDKAEEQEEAAEDEEEEQVSLLCFVCSAAFCLRPKKEWKKTMAFFHMNKLFPIQFCCCCCSCCCACCCCCCCCCACCCCCCCWHHVFNLKVWAAFQQPLPAFGLAVHI